MGKIGPQAITTIPYLLDTCLKSENVKTRKETVIAIGNIGIDTFKPILPAVLSMLHDESPLVRIGAITALSQYEVPNNDIFEALKKLSDEDKSIHVRKKASQTLLQLIGKSN